MTRHDDMIRLRHMLDHAKEAADLVAGKDKTERLWLKKTKGKERNAIIPVEGDSERAAIFQDDK